MSGSQAETLRVPETLGSLPVDTSAFEGALTGKWLGHFRIDRLLASGGMGEVYLATDTALNRPVAVKTLRPALARDERSLSAFLVEARAQASVVHPHVLNVHFVGEADEGLSFMAMELVEGGSLHDLLDRGGKLPWAEAARHMLGLAEGLAEAARLGIVHRDVKPSNVLVDRYGEAHLCDFGLAVAGDGMAPSALAPAPPRSIAGTMEYMAPEQARGDPVDERADIYALGATFYHLLTGGPPITRPASLPALLLAHEGPPPPPVRALRPDVPSAFARVVDRCLSRDREARFRSHGELVAALRRVQPQPVVPASPLLRLFAWGLEVAPAGWLARETFSRLPWLAFVLLLATSAGVFAATGTPPGPWLLRLRLRTATDGDVSPARALLRFALQHGFFLPLVYFLHEAYRGSRWAIPLGILAMALAAPPLLGAAGALAGRRRTLVDLLAGTRLLVDTR